MNNTQFGFGNDKVIRSLMTVGAVVANKSAKQIEQETIKQGKVDLAWLKLESVLPITQAGIIADLLRGEERLHFAEKMTEFRKIAESMPRLRTTDGQGGDAVVALHYFANGAGDWWVTEWEPRDYAFGLCDPFGDPHCMELGSLSLEEMAESPRVELDLHWRKGTTIDQAKIRKYPATFS